MLWLLTVVGIVVVLWLHCGGGKRRDWVDYLHRASALFLVAGIFL